MPTPRLVGDVDRLQNAGFTITFLCEEAGFTNIVVHGVHTSPLYRPDAVDVLIRVPLLYPDAAPDMFWTDPQLTLANGTLPKNADTIQNICMKPWRRFSWHRNGRWVPSADWIGSYLEFIRQRFESA